MDLPDSTTSNDIEQATIVASDEQNHLDCEENDTTIMAVDVYDADLDTFNMSSEITTKTPRISACDETKVSVLDESDLLANCTDECMESNLDTSSELNISRDPVTLQSSQSISQSLKSDLSISAVTYSSTSPSTSPTKIPMGTDRILDYVSSTSMETSCSERALASSVSRADVSFCDSGNLLPLGECSGDVAESSSHRTLSGNDIGSSSTMDDSHTKDLDTLTKPLCFPTLRNLIYPPVDTVPRDPRSTSVFPLDPGLGSGMYVHNVMSIPLDGHDTHDDSTSLTFATSSSFVGLVGGLRSPARFSHSEGEKSTILVAASSPSLIAVNAESRRNRGISLRLGDTAQLQQVPLEMDCTSSQEFEDEGSKGRVCNLTATDVQKIRGSMNPDEDTLRNKTTEEQSGGDLHSLFAEGCKQKISETVLPPPHEIFNSSGKISIEFKATQTIKAAVGSSNEIEISNKRDY